MSLHTRLHEKLQDKVRRLLELLDNSLESGSMSLKQGKKKPPKDMVWDSSDVIPSVGRIEVMIGNVQALQHATQVADTANMSVQERRDMLQSAFDTKVKILVDKIDVALPELQRLRTQLVNRPHKAIPQSSGAVSNISSLNVVSGELEMLHELVALFEYEVAREEQKQV